MVKWADDQTRRWDGTEERWSQSETRYTTKQRRRTAETHRTSRYHNGDLPRRGGGQAGGGGGRGRRHWDDKWPVPRSVQHTTKHQCRMRNAIKAARASAQSGRWAAKAAQQQQLLIHASSRSQLRGRFYTLQIRAFTGRLPPVVAECSRCTGRQFRYVRSLDNLLWTGHSSVAACNWWWSFICCCRGPRLWNTLPEDITSAPSLLVVFRDENWRLICFGNLIRTLYCSLCGMLRPVVLEVFT